jgi:hypothetical protein
VARIKVGSARIDENGKAHGGQAGSQTAKEVSAQDWYEHKLGWRVLRHRDPDAGKRAAMQMQIACESEYVGYDQHERDTLLAQAAKVGWDISKVKTPCETDCSALIRVCEAYAFGRDIVAEQTSARFYTGNMAKVLLATGLFYELTGSKYTEDWRRLGAGDILITKTSGHVVMVLENGDKYEGNVEPKEYALGERIIKEDDAGPDVKILQSYLVKLGYDVGEHGEDGDYGPDTMDAVEAFQTGRGLLADAEYGPETHRALMEAIEALGDDAPEIEAAPGGNLTVLDDDNWNVRTGPGTAYSKVGVLHPGDMVQEVQLDGWKAVRYKDEVRFVNEGAFVPEDGG